MTTEVEFQLSQLRDAAQRFERASQWIDQSIHQVQRIMDETLALGLGDTLSSDFAMRYTLQRKTMDLWITQLKQFSQQLTDAADQLENAALASSPVQVPVWDGVVRHGGHHRRLNRLLTPPPPPPDPISIDQYVSKVNQPVYNELMQNKNQLQLEQTRLQLLVQTRDQKMQDLTALRNRLTSFDPTTNPDSIPRVQALQGEIAALNGQIATAHQHINSLKDTVAQLTARLDRVRPGPGADLRLIASMEGSHTSEWVKAHTYDCVNYIVNRMPVPADMARNAYMWDNMAAQLPQYGITQGNVPLVGSVIVLERAHSYADHAYGHLMYVERVDNGVVWITDNNHPNVPVRLTDLTSETSGPNIHYLYFPWQTQA